MQSPKAIAGACALALASVAALCSGTAAAAQDAPDETPATQGGARDFDWEFGTWKTRVRRLADPLSGSRQWLEYEGTSVVRPLLDGRANLVELNVSGPAGRIEGVSLRLYNPQTRQWSLHYASLRSGMLTRPVFGGFRGGRGEFYGMEDLDRRAVLVRFVMSGIDTDTARFEQAYSADGGRTWETNWIATDSRVSAP
jgi:hypothetical protein